MWRLNNILLKSNWLKIIVKGELKRYIENNENDNATYQKFWDAAKAVIRGKFISLKPYFKKKVEFQINNTISLKHQEKRKAQSKKKGNNKN